MWGADPPATWAFAIFLAFDMLFLRLFPGGFGVFAFSQCESRSFMSTLREIREEFLFPTHHPLSAIFRIRSLGRVACWI